MAAADAVNRGACTANGARPTPVVPRITLRPLWKPPYEVPVPAFDHAGHGGGDARMLDALFGPVDLAAGAPEIDHANAVDGALALGPAWRRTSRSSRAGR